MSVCIVRMPHYKHAAIPEKVDHIFGPFDDVEAAESFLKNAAEQPIQSREEPRVFFANSPNWDTRYIFEIRPLEPPVK